MELTGNAAQPLFKWYNQALKNERIQFCTQLDLSTIDVNTLFVDRNAQLFIKKYFAGYLDGENGQSFKKLNEHIKDVTDFRARHTVSAFLLGAVIQKELKIDIRTWPHVFDNKPNNSFGFFWSIICLLHDIGYKLEYCSSKLLKNDPDTFKSIDSFCINEDIQYNLLEVSEYCDLIRNYYKKRINGNQTKEIDPQIDHGITGAILIYDSLMTIYHGVRCTDDDASFCGLKVRDTFPKFCRRIADAVALHNIWRAKPDDPDDVKEYRLYHLDELMPTAKDDRVVYYEKDPILLLLGLIDTLDPVKILCNDESGHKLIDVDVVLHEVFLSFINPRESKSFTIEFRNDLFEKIIHSAYGMRSWLGVDIIEECNHRVRLKIILNI